MQTAREYDLEIRNSGWLRNGPITNYQGTYSGNFSQYRVGDMVEYRGILYLVISTPMADPPSQDWLYLQTVNKLKLQIGNGAKFIFNCSGMYISTYEGTNSFQGYNDPSFEGNCAYISAPLINIQLSMIDYVSVTIQALSRYTSDGTSIIPNPPVISNTNRFTTDDYFYLNIVINTPSDGVKVIGASYKSGADSNGQNNPCGLPLTRQIQDITFRPTDPIWFTTDTTSLHGLPPYSTLTFQGGKTLDPDFTIYSDTDTYLTSNAEPDAPLNEILSGIVIRMSNANNTELREYRILKISISINNLVSIYDYSIKD